MKKSLIFIFLSILLLAPWPVAYAQESTIAGDLFYLDSKGAMDTLITLHLTNADELIHYFRYMIFRVGVYVQTGENEWERATLSDGEPVPDVYLTMRNGMVNFMLPGYSRYKITLDGGSFYSFSIDASVGGAASPNFYLTVE